MLFPLMPYESYRLMADDDVQALVAYMDTLPPVRNPLPKTEIPFPSVHADRKHSRADHLSRPVAR